MVSAVLLRSGLTPRAGRAPASPTPQQDSLAIRRSLGRAQRDFERLRRRFLPFAIGTEPTPCPERVGRFCVWPDTEDDWPDVVQTEHHRVVAAHTQLFTRLDSPDTDGRFTLVLTVRAATGTSLSTLHDITIGY